MKAKQLTVMVLIGLLAGCTPQVAEKVGATTTAKSSSIDWEAYDGTSTVSQDGITADLLQGEWAAYKGVYRFGEHVNAMQLEKPFIMEVEGDTYRRNKSADFKGFQLTGNVLTQEKEAKTETGIINKLTESELTITWKDGENYTRYYYQKSK